MLTPRNRNTVETVDRIHEEKEDIFGQLFRTTVLEFETRIAQLEESSTKQWEELTKQSEELTKQKEELTKQSEELTKQSEELTQQTNELTKQGDELTEQREESTKQKVMISELKDELERIPLLDNRVSRLENKVSQVGNQVVGLEKQVTDLQLRVRFEEMELCDLNDQVADLNAIIVARTARLDVVRVHTPILIANEPVTLSPDHDGTVIHESVETFTRSAGGMKLVVDRSPPMLTGGNDAARRTLPPREMYEQVVARNFPIKGALRSGWKAMIDLVYASFP
ncbi:hypothetical protein BV25DRAFT_1841722 [Artomyces pyxidatus]|uniref:Uncharacterized protein n=1 Tax=Artomyces pyxidatus TaxID=48021 RepID=A0ACB8SNB9_9AGAM|nr:hypothetical protein BV25DRAFT_1841722 [Artomyces pyxidatus]